MYIINIGFAEVEFPQKPVHTWT